LYNLQYDPTVYTYTHVTEVIYPHSSNETLNCRYRWKRGKKLTIDKPEQSLD
jgi:hypothetical protein